MAFPFGSGSLNVSLIGGCHADEPVGPAMLRGLVSYLGKLDDDHPLLTRIRWSIVPHVNPDGEVRNESWSLSTLSNVHPSSVFSISRYIGAVTREAPGDDMEFGFPDDSPTPERSAVRPENQAVAAFLSETVTTHGPFHLHASFHGLAFGGGPWFLIDEQWIDRTSALRKNLSSRVQAMGYVLHDVERSGEKGFKRIEKGFCTRPNALAMAQFFKDQKDVDTASLFRPSSMEFVRSLGGDPLTLVSEIPLFILEGAGKAINPTDPVADRFKSEVLPELQRLMLQDPEKAETLARQEGLSSMPIRDQLNLQVSFLEEGLNAVQERFFNR